MIFELNIGERFPFSSFFELSRVCYFMVDGLAGISPQIHVANR